MKASLQRIVRQLTANRRQFGVMMALVAVALVMWGKLIFNSSPRQASASSRLVTKAATPAAGDTRITPEPARAKVEVELSTQSRRDLFRMDMQDFVRIESSKVITPQNPKPEKSDEARRAEALARLTTLKLRSTIMQDDPKALLNDKLYQLGSEPLEGFRITQITQHSVHLKHKDWDEEFELRMYRN